MYYGCLKEIENTKEYKLVPTIKINNLPREFKITKMPSVKDQGICNSCVAFTLSYFLEQQYIKEHKIFSTGFIYGYRPDNYYQQERNVFKSRFTNFKNYR